MDAQGTTPSADDLRSMAKRAYEASAKDVLAWLILQRDLSSADREEGFRADDNVVANRADALTQGYARAAAELEKLRTRIGFMTETLVCRVELALPNARQPAWKATHRHYKGGEYRLLRYAYNNDGEELIDCVVYDDARGKIFTLNRERWESNLDSGTKRYTPLVEEAGLAPQ